MRIDLCGTTVSSISHDCEAQTLTLRLSERLGAEAVGASPAGPAGHVFMEGVAACHLEHALSTNLLEGIHEVDAAEFVRNHQSEFPSLRSPWPELPTMANTIDELVDAIRNAGVHVYVLESAWGLEGWVMAKSVRRTSSGM